MPANESEARIVVINRNVIDALLMCADLMRKYGRLDDNPETRELAYASANEFQSFVEEIWDCGFSFDSIRRTVDERNSSE